MQKPVRFVKYLLSDNLFAVMRLASLLVVCLAAFPSEPSYAQEAPSLTVTPVGDLSFGVFSVERGGGSVLVDARSGDCRPLAGALMLKNLCQRGQFEIHGQPEAQVMVEVMPANASSQVELKNLSLYPGGIVRLGVDGKARLHVGGELYTGRADAMTSVNLHYMVNVSYLQ